MGKMHVKGWGRKTNYLNGKVACQGLRVGVGKKCTQNHSFYTTNMTWLNNGIKGHLSQRLQEQNGRNGYDISCG